VSVCLYLEKTCKDKRILELLAFPKGVFETMPDCAVPT